MADLKTWGTAMYTVQDETQKTWAICVSGRNRWALEALMAVGIRGCTPIDTPGPRWAGYVHNLRNLGVEIETVTEAHKGPFAGTHARYVLRSTVTRQKGVAA